MLPWRSLDPGPSPTMEITCKRCQTEYDFDDALVSERGTTVRCTHCGDQFKVYRAASSTLPERWVVNRRDGRELVFTNLRDLQRAITNLQVGRHDTLTRGNDVARPLGAIAELEPFFLERLGTSGSSTPPPAIERARTEIGLPRREEVPSRSGRTGRPPADGSAVPPPAASVPSVRPSAPDAASLQSPRSPLAHVPAGDEEVHGATIIDPRQLDPRPLDARGSAVTAAYAPPDDPPYLAPPSPHAPQVGLSDARTWHDPDATLAPNDARISYSPEQDWFGEPRFSHSPRGGSRALRWMVVLVVLGMLGVAGATVGRKYLATAIRPTPAPAGNEARVDGLLEEGDRALADGDLETAKESFDKASALAERDPRVLIDLARLDAVRADFDWLKVRLLAGSSDKGEALAAAKRQAQQSAQRALKQSDRAAQVAPDDPRVARAKIDALRLNGESGGARLLVARVGSIAPEPETSYVLAALDLSEESPSWTAVLDRLRAAAAGEQGLSRARSTLVYALVRAGDKGQAKGELEKIVPTATHAYPLLPELKDFVARAAGDKGQEADAGRRAAPVGPASGAAIEPHAAADPRAATEPRGEGDNLPAGDFRSLLRQASQATASRQFDRADQLYRAALVKNPGDTEALSGLGDVARARGNSAAARSAYEQVLARNPHYVPAIAALADLKWDSGDRAGAVKLYRDLVETLPEGSAGSRAKDRIAQAEGTPKAQRPAATPASEAPSPSPSPDVPPGVDTSDLPGFKR